MPENTKSKNGLMGSLIKQKYSYLFIAPAVVLFGIFVFIPVLASFFLSFTKYNILTHSRWVGLDNYYQIFFHDPRFWKALRNTVVYTLGVVPLSISIALSLAVAIDQKIKFKNFYKSMFFMPIITSVIAYSIIWRWLFAGEKYGLINHLLIKIGSRPVDWLINPNSILPTIMIVAIWGGLGYNMFILLAGLQTIPQVFYDAAEVDGASSWQKFWYVTLPLLRPTLLFVLIMSVINSFQVFEQAYIMTAGTSEGVGGVLDSALTLVSYLYEKGFQRFEMGYASALAYILFGIIFLVTLINIRLVNTRRVEY